MTDTGLSWAARRWSEVFLAGTLLTRLPIPKPSVPVTVRPMDGLWAFPLFGALIGGLSACAYALASLAGLPNTLASLAALAAGSLVTGLLHEDGLGDTADGIGGGKTRAEKLVIMRDSRMGTYGTAALFFTFAARWAALSVLSPQMAVIALITAHMAARGFLALHYLILSSARTEGLSVSAGTPQPHTAIASLAIACLGTVLLVSIGTALIALTVTATVTLLSAWFFFTKLGGYTGDTLGATEQVCEIAILWTLAAAHIAAS